MNAMILASGTRYHARLGYRLRATLIQTTGKLRATNTHGHLKIAGVAPAARLITLEEA